VAVKSVFANFAATTTVAATVTAAANATLQGDHAGSSSGAAPRGRGEKPRGRGSGACHHCGQMGHFIAQCPVKQQEGSAATLQQVGKAKAQ
jgi:hypothetical protein